LNHDFETPGIWRRMACWPYEGLLLFAVLFIGDYLLDSLSQSRHGLDKRDLRQLFLFVLLGIYFVWFWSKGQTLPMKTWHIRLVDRDGAPVSQLRALARYLLSWLWLLPPLMAYALGVGLIETLVLVPAWIAIWAILSRFHPQQQFWHDAWAGTRLVTSLSVDRVPTETRT
jgi:uncharacterized RDD family membrane protein YckC